MTNISNILGERIRHYRKSQHLSQEKLSELANLHPTYIGQLERGEKNASVETLYKICNALDVPITTLLEKIDEYKANEPLLKISKLSDINSTYAAIEIKETNHEINIPLTVYEILSKESLENQKNIFTIVTAALKVNRKFQ